MRLRPKILRRIFLVVSLVIFSASILTCELGIDYAVSQVPKEERERPDFETDWIGFEWVLLSFGMQFLSLLLAGAGLALPTIVRATDTKERNPEASGHIKPG
jgi:hypothetical protein